MQRLFSTSCMLLLFIISLQNFAQPKAKTKTKNADGKTETHDVHEIWRFNKDGKVDFYRQFVAKPTMSQQ